MKPGGHYNIHSAPQRHAIELALPIVQEQASKLTQHLLSKIPETSRASSQLFFVDYGSSQGANSLLAIQEFLRTFRKSFPTSSVSVVHEDTQLNDWNTLFRTSSRESLKDEKVFVFGSATSFYEQVVPAQTVDFAFSAAAFHWQKLPLPQVDPFECGGTYGTFPNEFKEPARSLFAEHARRGWKQVIEHRSTEMRDGGRAVFVVVAASTAEDRQPFWSSTRVAFDRSIVKAIEKGLILKEEARKVIMNVWMFSKEEILEPLKDCGFELERYELIRVDDPLWKEYERTKDKTSYADGVMNFYRSVSEGTIGSKIAPDRREKALEAIYGSMTEHLAELCESHPSMAEYACHVIALRRDFGLKAPTAAKP